MGSFTQDNLSLSALGGYHWLLIRKSNRSGMMTMGRSPFFLKRPRLLFSILVLSLALGAGCGSDGDKVVVDFSKTVSVERPGERSSPNPPLRVAVAAMISPRETFDLYRQLLAYLGHKMGRDLEFVQRKTYGEIDELLGQGQIDLAFICSGPYVAGKDRYGFIPLAIPEVQGEHFYRSYLIVNRKSSYKRLEDLQGHTFAFTDPDSNTGRLVPTYWLAQLKAQPETFFGGLIYTYSHDNSIMAVARGLVDGAAVDGLVWEFYQARNPAFTSKTRVIKKSEPYGLPPLVASRLLAEKIREQIRQLLLSMHQDPEGRHILSELLIDRFVPVQEEWYDNVRKMHQHLAQLKDKPHAP